jgi:methylphosphotriester-DNA--protein-cysteine methyltransferase
MGNVNRILFVALFWAVVGVAGCGRSVPAAAPAYVAASTTRTVHRADCGFVARVKPSNRIPFDHLPDALAEGYKPCRYCLRAAYTKPAIAIEEKP